MSFRRKKTKTTYEKVLSGNTILFPNQKGPQTAVLKRKGKGLQDRERERGECPTTRERTTHDLQGPAGERKKKPGTKMILLSESRSLDRGKKKKKKEKKRPSKLTGKTN